MPRHTDSPGSDLPRSEDTDEEVSTAALKIVRNESREVLSEQIRLLNDLDDKAMRSVRTSVLFIGLVISAIQISNEPPTVSTIGIWPFRLATGGVTFLILSVITGIYTYSDSDPNFGVSNDHRKDVVEGEFTEREWLLFQLDEYDEWTDSMTDINERNVVGLHTTLVSAVIGVIALLLSAIWSAGVDFSQVITPILITTSVFILIAVVLSWRR